MMKLGYGTYGMKEVDPFEAVVGLKEIGFDAIEIAATKGWPTAPAVFGQGERKRLVLQSVSNRTGIATSRYEKERIRLRDASPRQGELSAA